MSLILVINPNSNTNVTDAMATELDVLTIAGGPEIECMTLAGTPYGIESQADIEAVILPIREVVANRDDVDAFVIACYSDPGLLVCREATNKPVYGIQECGVLTAMSQGDKFGVIALHNTSIKRHLRYLRQMGVLARLAAERSVNLSVEESASGEGTFDRLCITGAELRDQDGADIILLGCAGMARHRKPLERFLGIQVIDPIQAAVSMAIGRVLVHTGIS